MQDRELLELAAKAAGLKLDKSKTNGGGVGNTGFDLAGNAILDLHNDIRWNPLTDDGDALRLAVKLGLSVTIFDDAVGIGCRELPDGQKYEETPLGDDPYATTRQAIVRAAAEIGKRH